jgi:Transposase, Mutator family
MVFREVSVIEIREVLRAWLAGKSERAMAAQAGVDRKTSKRYVRAAVAAGLSRGGGEEQLTDELIGQVVSVVRPVWPDGHGQGWAELEGRQEEIAVWVDGIHLKVRLEQDKVCLLVMVGVHADGTKELVALDDGHRESTESWLDLLRSCKRRGMRAPVLAIGDRALGFWAALREVFPETREQRCWVHYAQDRQRAQRPAQVGPAGREGRAGGDLERRGQGPRRDRSALRRGAPPRRRGSRPAQPQGESPPQGRRDRRHRLAYRHGPAPAAASEGPQGRPGVPDRPGGPASSCRDAISTRRAAGRGCLTGRARTCSRQRPAARPCTSSGTAR